MRKIYVPLCDDKNSVEAFLQNLDDKVHKKFIFCLERILDKHKPLAGPYIKHFSMHKYSMFYELRVRAADKIVRIIFCENGGDICFLYAFYKKDSKDTDKALKIAERIFEQISHNGYIKAECRREADFGD